MLVTMTQHPRPDKRLAARLRARRRELRSGDAAGAETVDTQSTGDDEAAGFSLLPPQMTFARFGPELAA
jgi:hypothetical protein